MVHSFYSYVIYEYGPDSFIKELINSLFSTIKKKSTISSNYKKVKTFEFIDPLTFDLSLIVRRDSSPDFKSDEHFKSLPWEEINFKNNGFSIDGNTYMDHGDLVIPEIELVLLLDPSKEPKSYNQLFYKLNDILAHELHHLTQVGWNRKPFRTRPTYNKERSKSKSSYKYFLLPDEIESMVKGMYRSAKLQKKPLDSVFDDYLMPFIEKGYISEPEYKKVMEVWVKFALENYPGVKFSSKVEKIVNSI